MFEGSIGLHVVASPEPQMASGRSNLPLIILLVTKEIADLPRTQVPGLSLSTFAPRNDIQLFELLHQISQHRLIDPLRFRIGAFFKILVANKFIECVQEAPASFQKTFLHDNVRNLL